MKKGDVNSGPWAENVASDAIRSDERVVPLYASNFPVNAKSLSNAINVWPKENAAPFF